MNSLGSRPRSKLTRRIAAAMLKLASRMTPSAVASEVAAESGGKRTEGCMGPIFVQQHRSAKETLGIQTAQNEIGVGHGGFGSPVVVAGRPGHSARAVGSHALNTPTSSTEAILPPPVPT